MMATKERSRSTWIALLGIATGAATAGLLAPSCALNSNPHEEPDGYDLGSEYFAEMATPELPAGGCMPSVNPPVYFDAVESALKTLGCTPDCHGAGMGAGTPPLFFDPSNATTSYNNIVNYMPRLLSACDGMTDKLITQPADPVHASHNFVTNPAFQTLVKWVQSCAPLSAGSRDQGCSATGSGTDAGPTDTGGGTDTPVPTDTPPPPPGDMTGTADTGGGCNTTGLTYTTDIDPIVTGTVVPSFSCLGCHSAGTPTLVAGNPAANYQQLGGASTITSKGYLYSSGHPAGQVITPGSCQDMQVKAWVQAGAPQ
jgi:hypothetical protein